MKLSFDNFIINYHDLEKADRLKKRFLLLVFFFLVVHHSLTSIFVFDTDKLQSLVEGLCALCAIVGIILLKKKHDIIYPTAMIAIYGFFSISIGVWENGGVYSSEMGWFIITIFSVGVVLNRKIGIILYFFSFGFVLVMWGLQYANYVDLSKKLLVNGLVYPFLSNFSIFIIIGFIIIFIFNEDNLNQIWKKDKDEKISNLETKLEKQLLQEKINSLNFTKQLIENTEIERKRIATDLHDSISHELLNLKSLYNQNSSVLNDKIDSIINDIRSISRNLHPALFEKIGLVPNIEQLIVQLQSQNNFFVSTEINYNSSLTASDELQIYRIIQESLTNIIKYANAHAAKITIIEESEIIMIEIRDNGKGFDVTQTLNSGKAFGLHNIIERSRVVGGEANIHSSADGTIIQINIPKKS